MKEELENLGHVVKYEPSSFEPLRKYCERKGLNFHEEVKNWMYMYHDQTGAYTYKHVDSRKHLTLSMEGRDTDSIIEKIKDVFSGNSRKRMEANPTVLDLLKKVPGLPSPDTPLDVKTLKEKVNFYHLDKQTNRLSIELMNGKSLSIQMVSYLSMKSKEVIFNQSISKSQSQQNNRDLDLTR